MFQRKNHISKFVAIAILAIALIISFQSPNVHAKTEFFSNNHQSPSGLNESDDQTPAITSVSPNHSNNLETVTITISGQNLSDIQKVTLGSIILPDLNIVSFESISVTVPENIPAGVYSLTVTDSNDASASLENGYTINSSGDGSLTLWQEIKSLPEYFGQASVQNNGYLYVLGGRNTNNSTNTVIYAKINSDGSLNNWETTSPLIHPRAYFSSVIVGEYIYVMGGEFNIGPEVDITVEKAHINSNGSLGTWTFTESLSNIGYGFSPTMDSVANKEYMSLSHKP